MPSMNVARQNLEPQVDPDYDEDIKKRLEDPDWDQEGREEEDDATSHSLEDHLHEIHNTSSKAETEGLPSVEWLKANFKTKSAVIRYLQQLGFDAKVISKHLNIKYQHARNVMHQVLKRGPNEVADFTVQWACTHTKPTSHIDVILRQGLRDPNQSRVLYRVCTKCAFNLVPGVTEETVKRLLPGVEL